MPLSLITFRRGLLREIIILKVIASLLTRVLSIRLINRVIILLKPLIFSIYLRLITILLIILSPNIKLIVRG